MSKASEFLQIMLVEANAEEIRPGAKVWFEDPEGKRMVAGVVQAFNGVVVSIKALFNNELHNVPLSLVKRVYSTGKPSTEVQSPAPEPRRAFSW